MNERGAGDALQFADGGHVGFALELHRADEALGDGPGQPLVDAAEDFVGVADDVPEYPVEGALGAEVDGEGAAFDERYVLPCRQCRVDGGLVDAQDFRAEGGGHPGPESSIMKLSTVDIEQRTHQLAVDIIGYHALAFKQLELGPDYAAAVVPTYLNSRAASIFGGSREIQYNIIAKAVLGL